MAISAIQCFSLLLVFTASINTASPTALQKRSDDVSPQALMTLIQQQAVTIQKMESKLTSAETQLTSVAAELNSVKTNVNNINARFDTTVLFTAQTSQSPVTIGTSSPIRFDAVVSNVGGGYNPTIGVFTAPVSGVYVVYAQLMKQMNGTTLHWAIDKSGTLLCTATLEENISYDKSSCLATTRMQKGEQVFVRRDDGSVQIQGASYCSFSGFLLSRDP